MNVMLVSLGCDKNLVDSEMMLGMLSDAGYTITNEEEEAEVIIVNSCCFIMDAKEESINTLIELGTLKKTGKLKVLIAAGCLAQRYEKEIHEDLPEVDAVVGTTGMDQLVPVIESVLNHQKMDAVKSVDLPPICGKKRILSNGGYYAYLKIAEGCDKCCTYCIIPKIRGHYRSVPMEVLVEEAKSLAEQGVKELILVAQETTLYGKDLYGKKSLSVLLKQLCQVDGIEWIRLMYCYPEEIDDELIRTIKEEEKICHYLDLPIQHANDYILQRMGRRTNQEFLTQLIAKLRKEIPDICLRTTLIVGFPGETEEMFRELAAFVNEIEFDRLGVFTYSPEEDTVAAQMPEQIPEEVKEYRRDEIMQLQQEIAFEKAEAMIGRTVPVIIDGRLPEEGILVARTYMDAPGVDGNVFIETDRELYSGTIEKVRITESSEYDLIGGLEDEFTK
ncbi:MAG: 30S ribosomal protein S12 methylthiotransferase RimO [Lachnospiraceae bacterium]|nr:30S ribosomal protein S12 methylthiotransferase RimO [Lachnospiraceae bacterium]